MFKVSEYNFNSLGLMRRGNQQEEGSRVRWNMLGQKNRADGV